MRLGWTFRLPERVEDAARLFDFDWDFRAKGYSFASCVDGCGTIAEIGQRTNPSVGIARGHACRRARMRCERCGSTA
jgi:hypothetical protein